MRKIERCPLLCQENKFANRIDIFDKIYLNYKWRLFLVCTIDIYKFFERLNNPIQVIDPLKDKTFLL